MNLKENPIWNGLSMEFGKTEYNHFMQTLRGVLDFEVTDKTPELAYENSKLEALAQDYLTDIYLTFMELDISNLLPIEKKFLVALDAVWESGLKIGNTISKDGFLETFGNSTILSLVVLEGILIEKKHIREKFNIDFETIREECAIIEDHFYTQDSTIDRERYIEFLQKPDELPLFVWLLFQVRDNAKLSNTKFSTILCENIENLADFFGDRSLMSNAILVSICHFFELSEEQSHYLSSTIELPGEDGYEEEGSLN